MEHFEPIKNEAKEICNCKHLSHEKVADIYASMPDGNALSGLADFYKVFAEPTRIKILYALFYSEMCVCDLAEILKMNQTTISHQLRTLKQMKMVRNKREGKSIFYSLADDHIKTILNQGMEHIKE
ncbi:MAG: metalloregulator ArsR/SmtB family transcription factor [Lachnospiraceae bacterium]|nr:metalloregulator ArsR/SmtB family transcription factor [Lachnospiraceae bacterium]